MEKTVTVSSQEFKHTAAKTIRLAFMLCESRVRACKGKKPCPELKALSSAAVAMENAIAVFISLENLCE